MILSGEPAYIQFDTSPDWVPTLKLGHDKGKKLSSDCYSRLQSRKVKKSYVSSNNNDPAVTSDTATIASNIAITSSILNDVIPIEMVLAREGEELTTLDKIVFVACALHL
jgi:hypothetical protein